MAFWHPLKGVLSHSTPDWYVDRLAYCGTLVNGSNPEKWMTFWNDSKPGVNFYVYKIVLSDLTNFDDYQFIPTQQLVGSFRVGAFPVLLSGSTPPGKMYFGNFATIPSQTNSIGFQVSCGSQAPAILDASFPLFVIPPNSGIAIAGTAATDQFATTFWYVWK
jgi:hypothetical protein